MSELPDPKQQVLPSSENLFKALLLIALLLASFYSADRLAAVLDSAALPAVAAFVIKWSSIAVLAVVDGVLLLGMAVLAHDAVHRVLFRSAFWNEFWGGVLSALALIPFYANRQFHLTHHSYAHQSELDPENRMHHRPFLQAATIGSLIGLWEQYRIFLTNARRYSDRRCRSRALKDACFLAINGAFYFWLVPAMGISLMHGVVPMILLFPMVFAFRALSDHYGVPAAARDVGKRQEVIDVRDTTAADAERRQREVSGWVVRTSPWLEWLWSHVNYHEVHHKFPYLSHRYLPRAFAATRAHYPYLVVNGYWRSLWNLRKCEYYTGAEEVKSFLSVPVASIPLSRSTAATFVE